MSEMNKEKFLAMMEKFRENIRRAAEKRAAEAEKAVKEPAANEE